jgi:hypothetical protein
MTRSVIYYPFIKVPQTEWFTRILIYWDRVDSIVPDEYHHEYMMGEYMSELVDEKLVQPISPRNEIRNIPNFNDVFLNHVRDDNYPVKKNTIKEARKIDIHLEKLDEVGDGLVELGLAIKRKQWYLIESYTGNLFMSYLAYSLGNLPQFNSKPMTDNIADLNMHSSVDFLNGKMRRGIEKDRATIFRKILPAPTQVLFPLELIEFKEANKKELMNFRKKVEEILIEAANIEKPFLREEKIDTFIEETKDEIDYIKNTMESFGWKNITLKDFLAYSSAVFGVGGAIKTGNVLPLVAAAFGFGHSVLDFIEKSKRKDELHGNYASYAVLAQNEFG